AHTENNEKGMGFRTGANGTYRRTPDCAMLKNSKQHFLGNSRLRILTLQEAKQTQASPEQAESQRTEPMQTN
ncbi:MAG: hypothetical protein ACO1OQ_06430, partial [Rufibacter sp.]